MNRTAAAVIALFLFAIALPAQVEVNSSTSRPWTYWWWMGSAVDREGISRELEQFADSGMGGVHIIPIYGAKGYEARYLDFFSEEWLEMVQYTIDKADSLGMGVDISLAAGWPYGGPWVKREDVAMQRVQIDIPVLDQDSIYFDPLQFCRDNNLAHLMVAFLDNGYRVIRLADQHEDTPRTVAVPEGEWTFRSVAMKPTGQQVKRAGPGGEGPVINYLDKRAVGNYLEHFDSILAFTDFPITPRAIHHESYEAYDAAYTYGLLDSFESFHGYALTDYAPFRPGELMADDSLLIHDLRLVTDQLLYNGFAKQWSKWAKHLGAQSRYQAHGSPANLLDLYALASIPETEAFGCSGFPIPGLLCDQDYDAERFERPDPLMMKFASSPAHLLGKPLVSGEVGTWLANHFKVSLRKVKPEIDQLFVGGVNHIFYQGSTYSPPEAGYPGWLNYAASNFGPSSGFYDELPLLNDYVRRCQEKLQTSTTDNDVLVLFSLQDYWAKRPLPVLRYLDVHDHGDWFDNTSFGRLVHELDGAGYAFDYVSDRQLLRLTVTDDGEVMIPGGKGRYRTIVVPEIDYIHYRSVGVLQKLARQGVHIVFDHHLPANYADLVYYQSEVNPAGKLMGRKYREFVTVTDDVAGQLDRRVTTVRREGLREAGLDFIRKRTNSGNLYFVVNLGGETVDRPLWLGSDYSYVSITDPVSGHNGYLATDSLFRLTFPPGRSYLLETSTVRPDLPAWKTAVIADSRTLPGPWSVAFSKGRDAAPRTEFHPDALTSWTEWNNDTLDHFSGRASYRTTFRVDPTRKGTYSLAFDQVYESAEVWLNGKPQGTVWAFPNTIQLNKGDLKRRNQLEVVVRNLDANYIRTFDRAHPEWKNFYDVNFVGISYRPFSTASWPVLESGIVGEVRLIRRIDSEAPVMAAGK